MMRFNKLKVSPMSIYIGFRLEINGVNWYFKDSVQEKYRNPKIWCMTLFQF